MLDTTGNNVRAAVSQPRRRGHGYRSSIEQRAAFAAGLVQECGWTAKRAAGLLCVNRSYLDLARKLSDDDRRQLARGELKLSELWRNHRRQLAERRAQRAAEHEARLSYRIHIGWGGSPDEGDETRDYKFDTEAEKEAFLYGVDQAVGWMDAEQFDEPHTYTYNGHKWVPAKAEDVPTAVAAE